MRTSETPANSYRESEMIEGLKKRVSENASRAPRAWPPQLQKTTSTPAQRHARRMCAIVATAPRGADVTFVLAPDRALFPLEWRGPYDRLIDEAIMDNYEEILAWLVREAEGEA